MGSLVRPNATVSKVLNHVSFCISHFWSVFRSSEARLCQQVKNGARALTNDLLLLVFSLVLNLSTKPVALIRLCTKQPPSSFA